MTPDEFAALAAAGHNRIPLTLDILADLETPLSVYLKLAHGQPYTYLLESAANGGEVWGRYSFIGLHARTVLRVRGHTVTVHVDDVLVEEHHCEDPLAFIEAFHARHQVPQLPGLPRFQGGLVGYFGYDTVRFIERKLADTSPPDDVGTPDILLMVSDDVIAFDNIKGRMTLISLARPDEPDAMARTRERLEGIAAALRRQAPLPPVPGANQPVGEDDFVSVFGQQRYMAAVDRIRDYILAGDCMQVVLAQRMAAPYSGDALNLYRGLRYLNPSPYMFLMDLGDHQIVSSSPEILARLEDGVVTSRPLAGTRRRGRDAAEDLALEQELLADPKEIAEHLMLIDLHRNDVGRVATTGSVEVTERFVIERYSHVMHISSNVRGRLREGCTAIDLLRATLPVGTLSGAPKVRAMEIIDELEPVRRGIYGGAVGYLAWNGNMDTAIAIRTAVLKDGKLYISAGAGVVADSVADLEWKETMNKARAIFAAAALAERGFRPLD